MNPSGNPLDLLFAFFGGVLVSFTPCVYPLIPISAGYIGVRSSGSRLKGFLLSLCYTTGIAVTYSVLGLIAALSGTFFGKVSSNPITYIIAGTAVVVFGLSMLDFFNLPLPNLIRLPRLKQGSYFSTFTLGLVSGFIATPCLTPVLGSILFYIAAKKNVLYGAGLLFSFAYGMGTVLILVGTFSSALLGLPGAGKWMAYIKRFCAALLIIAGAYLIFNGIRRV